MSRGRPIVGSSIEPKGYLMNKDQAEGAAKDAIGKAQEKSGKLAGSPVQQAKGLAKQAEGRLQKASGDVKEAFRNSRHK